VPERTKPQPPGQEITRAYPPGQEMAVGGGANAGKPEVTGQEKATVKNADLAHAY
jgi:hypothetical protein